VLVVEVLVCVPFGEEFNGRLRAVDPRLRVREAPSELRRWMRSERMDDPELRAVAEQQSAEYLDPAEVLIGWARLPREALARARKLRWIQTAGAGMDRLNPDDYRHLTLTNASGVAAVAMAEYVIGVILMFAKDFPGMLRRQQARQWDRHAEAIEVEGKTCGIVGMGAIGAETARRARALGMRVIATRRSVATRTTDDLAHELLPATDLPYLLSASDYVVVAAPLTPETRGMIGAAELRQMKRSAVLINVGRGAILDEQAVIAALRDGVIAGAGLDVFEQEPLPTDSPLWGMENVVVTPHFSAGSERYAERAADIICDNLRRYLDGRPLRNLVDLDLGY
jgi:D-2-hydroxyacid dehydrogenase (NADP+)